MAKHSAEIFGNRHGSGRKKYFATAKSRQQWESINKLRNDKSFINNIPSWKQRRRMYKKTTYTRTNGSKHAKWQHKTRGRYATKQCRHSYDRGWYLSHKKWAPRSKPITDFIGSSTDKYWKRRKERGWRKRKSDKRYPAVLFERPCF